MTIRPITNSADHEAAIERIGELWGAEPGTNAFAELDALATLVEVYEKRQIEIPDAAPLDMLQYAVTEMGHSQAELAELLGSKSRASEVLSGRRALTLAMIRTISRAWSIPVDLLVGDGSAPHKAKTTARPRSPSAKNHVGRNTGGRVSIKKAAKGPKKSRRA